MQCSSHRSHRVKKINARVQTSTQAPLNRYSVGDDGKTAEGWHRPAIAVPVKKVQTTAAKKDLETRFTRGHYMHWPRESQCNGLGPTELTGLSRQNWWTTPSTSSTPRSASTPTETDGRRADVERHNATQG
eukprot:4153618-Amphidinium_carterae.1